MSLQNTASSLTGAVQTLNLQYNSNKIKFHRWRDTPEYISWITAVKFGAVLLKVANIMDISFGGEIQLLHNTPTHYLVTYFGRSALCLQMYWPSEIISVV